MNADNGRMTCDSSGDRSFLVLTLKNYLIKTSIDIDIVNINVLLQYIDFYPVRHDGVVRWWSGKCDTVLLESPFKGPQLIETIPELIKRVLLNR